MFQPEMYTKSKQENYQLLIKQLEHLVKDEPSPIANLANAAALLNQFLDHVNWVGFYLLENKELVLGPFQGLPACVRIPLSKGVCGTAAANKEVLRIKDVHQFPGHIACDAASKSEIVIPIILPSGVYGVLDIDSPSFDRFDELDEIYLKEFVAVLATSLPS